MKRFLISAFAIAITIPLAAAPSMAVTSSAGFEVPVVDSEAVYAPAADPVVASGPAGDQAEKADARAQRLRDKMPFISKLPSLVGNDIVWKVDISPMRVTF